ncbi:MFS transporter, partial [Candidatus Bathyarchaeota archaeon]|nr:MFS transporter [Candidatus Bathyarchaeota archaeon]
ILGGEAMKLTKLTLIIVGILLLVMGIAGLPGVSDMGTEPDWHAILKIVIGIVAVLIALMEKRE